MNNFNILSSVLFLTKKLIKRKSISPIDNGCQEILIDRLNKLGFIIKLLPSKKTSNFIAWHGNKEPTLAFSGHTDVVGPGNICNWYFNPFNPTLYNGMLYGRGSVDMKGALSAMIVATEYFLKYNPYHLGTLLFLITSDEESEATDGTIKIVDELISINKNINYCIIGEPSSIYKLGDNIKNGRRGSLTCNLTIYSKQKHVAYYSILANPIYQVINIISQISRVIENLNLLSLMTPPTTFQVINIITDNNYTNTTPRKIMIQLNFRFNYKLKVSIIKNKIELLINKYNLNYKINWVISSNAFISRTGKLLRIVKEAINFYQGIMPSINNNGGTSDGRFINKLGTQIIELGLINKTIHQENECVSITDLQQLVKIYYRIIKNILT
ncbi:MAG: succinyl-diaminopimelate desuccinylase [Candidatus Lightella neohaematopini]|nr:succinyl-diaminopimelate desuccinylase [Candidatus Lightella neohaematopini]